MTDSMAADDLKRRTYSSPPEVGPTASIRANLPRVDGLPAMAPALMSGPRTGA